ncbi:DNA primase [Mycoplasma sp. P36-A1]|uniref:DNA primase n=1 Tax=Mycoplasma sp. P36-A1 TaxID=3252900 RepID=UPI003C2E6D10
MARISEDKIKEILDKVDIVDVISNEIELIQKGKNFLAVCPFHNDTNPSMSISQEKQLYKCFSCGAGGNALTFLKEYKKISFIEALQILADFANIELNISSSKNSTIQTSDEYNKLRELNKEAKILFDYLMDDADSPFLDVYLKDRTITKDIIDYFKIGFNSSENVLTNLLKAKNYDMNDAVKLDLVRVINNEYFDNYNNRVVFPIIDSNNNVVGFSARALLKDQTPKYLNSRDSILYDKSKILYNINNAKEEIKSSKTVYITEGPNDVIAFYRANIKNCVCVMGTAFTQKHLDLLYNLGTKNIVLAYDGDVAGQNATYKTLKLIEQNRFNVKCIDFEKLDPDEYFFSHGSEAFVKKISNPISSIDFLIKYKFNNTNMNNYEDKKKTVISLVSEMNKISDQYDKQHYFNVISKISNISVSLLNSFSLDINTSTESYERPKKIIEIESENAIDKASKIILYYMMNDIKYYNEFNDSIKTFTNKHYRKLYNAISAFYLSEKIFDFTVLASMNADKETIAVLMQIVNTTEYEEYSEEKIFEDSIKILKLETLMNQFKVLDNKLKITVDPIEKSLIAKEKQELNREIRSRKREIFK